MIVVDQIPTGNVGLSSGLVFGRSWSRVVAMLACPSHPAPFGDIGLVVERLAGRRGPERVGTKALDVYSHVPRRVLDYLVDRSAVIAPHCPAHDVVLTGRKSVAARSSRPVASGSRG